MTTDISQIFPSKMPGNVSDSERLDSSLDLRALLKHSFVIGEAVWELDA
jgi:hypothetical protein